MIDWRPKEGLSGVGGWLMLRVVQLVLFVPVSTFISLLVVRPITLWLVWGAVLGLVSLITGSAILMQRSLALWMVALDLALKMIFALAHMGWSLYEHVPDVHAVSVQSLATLMECFIWFFYFRLSARVRNTFGRNL